MLDGKKITLIVSGSISAYKSAEIVRGLKKQGADVRVVLTKGGAEFITALTLQTLSGNPVSTELFDLNQESQIGHIELADSADLVLVAPASASLIARSAYGLADDLATAVLLATKSPIVFAPAMNVNMWNNPLTQKNIETLKSVIGAEIIEPESGELACGWEGQGRLADIEKIIKAVSARLTNKDLVGKKVVVSAGGTREHLDPIRFLGNRSSGKMGYAIAERAVERGAEVYLVSAPTSLTPPVGVNLISVTTAEEMENELKDVLSTEVKENISEQILIMVSAVTDFKPKDRYQEKYKQDKSKPAVLELVPNADILRGIGSRRIEIEKESGCPLKLVGFSAESGNDEQILGYARKKLEDKMIDFIVANNEAESFEKDSNSVWVLGKNGKFEKVETASKAFVAERILNVVNS
jgi:phosphopantothenoylcysteine decarboxylase / phosphopantothenate---cysteine ligase